MSAGDALLEQRLERSPLFAWSEYARLNQDLHGLDQRRHFLDWGAWEPHRAFAERKAFARALGLASERLGEPDPAPASADPAALDVGVYVSSQGRFHVREIARLLADELRVVGARVALLDETSDPHGRPPVSVFVAPHEFFRLGRGQAWPRSETLGSSFVFSVDQITSSQFRAVYPYALSARGALDLYAQGALVWRDAGISALAHAPGPGWTPAQATAPELDLLHGLPEAAQSPPSSPDDWADRPLDVAFFGSESPARDAFFARNAAFLAERPCCLYYTRSLGVPLSDDFGGQRSAFNRHVAARSKIVLNLHKADVGAVNWPRMVMHGFWSKALLVSEPCAPHPVFRPGVHYLEESPRRIPKLMRWLLESADGREMAESVREQGWAAARAAPLEGARRLASFLAQAAPR